MRGRMAIALLALTAIGVIAMPAGPRGMTEDRVKTAFELAGPTVRKLCASAGLHYPPKQIFFRAFKSLRILQVWGSDGPKKRFRLIQTYDIAAMSGELGPKRKEGDLQVPEGIYYIDRFNPQSRFRLSLGLNYPNAADRKFADRERPGGDIFIHGNQVSIGCMAMTDAKIDQIYILALQAKNAGQQRIPVHVFPFPLTRENLEKNSGNPDLTAFWNDLKPIYDQFEKRRKVPSVKIDGNGRYSVK